MTAEQQLEILRKELSKTRGRTLRWQRICQEKKATTIQEQIACAKEALTSYHSGSWAEGMADSYRINELRLAEQFGGTIPDDFGE